MVLYAMIFTKIIINYKIFITYFKKSKLNDVLYKKAYTQIIKPLSTKLLYILINFKLVFYL